MVSQMWGGAHPSCIWYVLDEADNNDEYWSLTLYFVRGRWLQGILYKPFSVVLLN